jgi:hypothetical protein
LNWPNACTAGQGVFYTRFVVEQVLITGLIPPDKDAFGRTALFV